MTPPVTTSPRASHMKPNQRSYSCTQHRPSLDTARRRAQLARQLTAADRGGTGCSLNRESKQSTVAAVAVPPTIDVVSNDAYRHGVPHDQFSWLRANAPVCRMEVPDPVLYSPVWVLSSYQAVLVASKATDHFTVQRRVNLRRPMANRPQDVPRLRHVLNQDDPDHLRLRRIANKGFTPKMVRRFTQHYRRLAAGLVDAAVEAETFDFVARRVLPSRSASWSASARRPRPICTVGQLSWPARMTVSTPTAPTMCSARSASWCATSTAWPPTGAAILGTTSCRPWSASSTGASCRRWSSTATWSCSSWPARRPPQQHLP